MLIEIADVKLSMHAGDIYEHPYGSWGTEEL